MRGFLAVGLALLAWVPVSAGELLFANGSRLAGELSNETIMVSTGSGLIEIASAEVLSLSRDEIRLRDGRVIRGTLVGGQIRAQTSLGEIAVKVDELQAYRAGAQSAGAGAAVQGASASGAAGQAGVPTAPASPPPAASAGANGGISAGLPTMASYQNGSSTVRQASIQPAALTRESSRVLEMLANSVLYRDALSSSSQVGQVAAGQQVRYLDSIDRRLRILNLLMFDGGYWIKVRIADGTEGWVPADTVREVR